MRQIFLFLALLLAAGCGSRSDAPVPPVGALPEPERLHPFGNPVSYTIGKTISFQDGLKVMLVGINDSRCPENAQCIWEGELAPTLSISGGDIGLSPRQVILGTSRSADVALASYRFSLGEATENTAVVTVSKPGVEIQAVAVDEMIRVTTPQPEQIIATPFTITGEARGPWYFEASFPVKLLDATGKLIVETHAQARGDWMTNAFVPFSAELKFDEPATATGMLVLEKDNPSGEAERDATIRIPVRFRKSI